MKRIFPLLIFLIAQQVISQSCYQQSVKNDVSVLTGSALMIGVGIYANQQIPFLSQEDVQKLNPLAVNKFDRWACSQWSPKAAHLSDALLISCILSPGLLLASDNLQKDRETIGVIYFESMLLTLGVTQLVKGLTQRIRPGAYNPDAPDTFKYNNRNVRASFFSGHTSLSFAALVFMATVYDQSHSGSQWTPYVWGGAIGTASGVGILRILAGNHFPTDVIVGAVVGGIIGYTIPKLHESDEKLPGSKSGGGFKVSICIPL